MIVRTVVEEDVGEKCERAKAVHDANNSYVSRRLLTEKDEMGYTMTVTEIAKGTMLNMEYRNHLESCLLIEGEAILSTPSGFECILKPGMMYALDKNDKHSCFAKTDLKLVCVFIPALQDEVHNWKQKQDFYSSY